jgi:hypothetical protein
VFKLVIGLLLSVHSNPVHDLEEGEAAMATAMACTGEPLFP